MANTNDEQRRFHRVLFDTTCLLSDAKTQWKATVIDLSLSGALITIPENWTNTFNGELALTVLLNEGDIKIVMNVEIMHSTEDRLGLQRVKIDAESIAHLRRLVELNLGDMSLLERDLASMLN